MGNPVPQGGTLLTISEKPRFRHTFKDAVFLGQYGEEDLYYQQGQVAARFGDEPSDFLMAGTEMAKNCDSLLEAIERAQEQGLEMASGEKPVAVNLTSQEVIALATEEGKAIKVTRNHGSENQTSHTIQALNDGSIIETGTNPEKWVTSTKKFLEAYPEDEGEAWTFEQGGGKKIKFEDLIDD